MRTAVIVTAVLALCTALVVAPQPAAAGGGHTTGNVNMRTGPSTKYHRIVVIPRGAPVSIGQCARGNRWCRVNYRGHVGWVSRRYLSSGRVFVQRAPVRRYVPAPHYGRYYHGRRVYGRRYYYPRYGYYGGYYHGYRRGSVGVGVGYGFGGYGGYYGGYYRGSGVGIGVTIR